MSRNFQKFKERLAYTLINFNLIVCYFISSQKKEFQLREIKFIQAIYNLVVRC